MSKQRAKKRAIYAMYSLPYSATQPLNIFRMGRSGERKFYSMVLFGIVLKPTIFRVLVTVITVMSFVFSLLLRYGRDVYLNPHSQLFS